jgi:hypothetical protein
MTTPGSAIGFWFAGRDPSIGDFVDGGYFAGYISHTANGVPTHGLIVAPAATGGSGTGYTITTNRQWKTSQTFTTGSASRFNGKANTDAQVAAGIASHPAAKFCVDLSINGYSDWYLPARDELNIAYFNLKPTTSNNSTESGANPYSVPRRDSNFTTGNPGQTNVLLFQSGQAQAFTTAVDYHWGSDEVSTTGARLLDFNNHFLNAGSKTFTKAVRAFRRFTV